MSQSVPSVIDDVSDTVRTNYVGFASFTILVWDHVLTFSDEVEYVWKGKKGPIIYLFLFNRYFTPLGFIINLFEVRVTRLTVEVITRRDGALRCTHFIRYEGCTVAIAVEVVGLMMLLRIHALYPTRKWISGLLGVLLIVETAVNIYLISRGEPVLHNRASGVHACSMVFDPVISEAASASAWYPLLYDSIVFGLTVNRTLPAIRTKEAGAILRKLFEDGLLYYSVIFSITFVLTFMIVGAPPGTKNICAQMEQLLTVAMMSRITLSLKKVGRRGKIIPASVLFDGRSPDFFIDTFMQSAIDLDAPDAPLDVRAQTLKPSDRLVVHAHGPIQFAVPPSPQPSRMSDPFNESLAGNSKRPSSGLRTVHHVA
ncbi:hypothetical protein B0H10DRAFT_2215695 [Mycena sp. CBHHK59/15]|nr:hypothetical protein B0H10DRAFT_2215695 [Mycena sp. CBHHK59/15]